MKLHYRKHTVILPDQNFTVFLHLQFEHQRPQTPPCIKLHVNLFIFIIIIFICLFIFSSDS